MDVLVDKSNRFVHKEPISFVVLQQTEDWQRIILVHFSRQSLVLVVQRVALVKGEQTNEQFAGDKQNSLGPCKYGCSQKRVVNSFLILETHHFNLLSRVNLNYRFLRPQYLLQKAFFLSNFQLEYLSGSLSIALRNHSSQPTEAKHPPIRIHHTLINHMLFSWTV